MALDVLLVGLGVTAGAWLLYVFRAPRLPAKSAPPPALGPYRTPDELALLQPAAPEPTGPYHRCPQCGAPARRCVGCYYVRTDVYECEPHDKYDNTRCGVYREFPDAFLPYARGTSLHRLCSPQQRVRMELFGKRCAGYGLHVHQRCQRCGWHGVAYVAYVAYAGDDSP